MGEEELSDAMSATVKINANRRGVGLVTIRFASLDELDGMIARLRRPAIN